MDVLKAFSNNKFCKKDVENTESHIGLMKMSVLIGVLWKYRKLKLNNDYRL